MKEDLYINFAIYSYSRMHLHIQQLTRKFTQLKVVIYLLVIKFYKLSFRYDSTSTI